MRTMILPLTIAAAIFASAPALAQSVPATETTAAPLALKEGVLLRGTDGRILGRIDKIQLRDGQPVTVSLIYNDRFVRIPVTTLTSSAKGLVTSLGRKELAQLN